MRAIPPRSGASWKACVSTSHGLYIIVTEIASVGSSDWKSICPLPVLSRQPWGYIYITYRYGTRTVPIASAKHHASFFNRWLGVIEQKALFIRPWYGLYYYISSLKSMNRFTSVFQTLFLLIIKVKGSITPVGSVQTIIPWPQTRPHMIKYILPSISECLIFPFKLVPGLRQLHPCH